MTKTLLVLALFGVVMQCYMSASLHSVSKRGVSYGEYPDVIPMYPGEQKYAGITDGARYSGQKYPDMNDGPIYGAKNDYTKYGDGDDGNNSDDDDDLYRGYAKNSNRENPYGENKSYGKLTGLDLFPREENKNNYGDNDDEPRQRVYKIKKVVVYDVENSDDVNYFAGQLPTKKRDDYNNKKVSKPRYAKKPYKKSYNRPYNKIY